MKNIFTTHNSQFTPKAFTLAETLIVIGIIGVVAALTLPNLNHATGDKEKITRVKKIYSTLNEAYGRAEAIYGPLDEWEASSNLYSGGNMNYEAGINLCNRILEFMKVSKQGQEVLDEGNIVNTVLPDGMEISYISFFKQQDSAHYPNLKYLGYIWVDIDGANKGKNQEGDDLFDFDITSEGIYPSDTEDYDGCFYVGNGTFGVIHYCTRWVLENDNMDYLKADKNGVCPNGVQLSVEQTSCN